MKAGEEVADASDVRTLVLDASKAVLDAHCTPQALRDARSGQFAQGLWDALEEVGIPRAILPESRGGAGLSMQDAGGLLRQAAYYAAPVPLAETMLATWLLNAAEIEVPSGPLSVAYIPRDRPREISRSADAWTVRANAPAVPWGRSASSIVLLVERDAGLFTALIPAVGLRVEHAVNLADEPRDTISVDCRVPLNAAGELARVPYSIAFELGAALRTAQISGALQRALELSVSYTLERKQFGRPIAKFQTVQHNLAMLAGQAAAANGAAELALAVATRHNATMAVAAAKARASEAATVGAALAHQVHGAIGVTNEYALHHYTQRLWSWRDEFGGEAYWWNVLGRSAMSNGPESYWQNVCEVDDPVAGRI